MPYKPTHWSLEHFITMKLIQLQVILMKCDKNVMTIADRKHFFFSQWDFPYLGNRSFKMNLLYGSRCLFLESPDNFLSPENMRANVFNNKSNFLGFDRYTVKFKLIIKTSQANLWAKNSTINSNSKDSDFKILIWAQKF